jgi:hypothetical protein
MRVKNKKTPVTEPEDVILQPAVVDIILQELLGLASSGTNEEEQNLDCFPPDLHSLVGGLVRKSSNEVFAVKTHVRTVLKRQKGKKKC